MKISDSIIRKWIRETIDDFIEEKSSVNEDVISEASVKYDYNKTMKLVKKDAFLQKAFKNLRGGSKNKAEKIFNNFIVGDRKMEKIYVRI